MNSEKLGATGGPNAESGWRRQAVHALIGAAAGGLAGAVAAVLAAPVGPPLAAASGTVATLGGALGYRYGRGVAAAFLDALTGLSGSGPQ
jgi:hypothetical protein